jgi:hypothetical protein
MGVEERVDLATLVVVVVAEESVAVLVAVAVARVEVEVDLVGGMATAVDVAEEVAKANATVWLVVVKGVVERAARIAHP